MLMYRILKEECLKNEDSGFANGASKLIFELGKEDRLNFLLNKLSYKISKRVTTYREALPSILKTDTSFAWHLCNAISFMTLVLPKNRATQETIRFYKINACIVQLDVNTRNYTRN